MTNLIFLRGIIIFVVGVVLFEFILDYKLPGENNWLLFFVAIPIIWATLTQLWTSYGYKDATTPLLYWITHILGIMMLLSTVFLISAVLNTLNDILDLVGIVMFHAVGWTVIFGLIVYDAVDYNRR